MKILVLWLGMHSTVYVHGLAFQPSAMQTFRPTPVVKLTTFKAIPPRLPWAVPTATDSGLAVPLPPPCIGCGKISGNNVLRPKFKPGGLNSR
jgi:hypothetical protein